MRERPAIDKAGPAPRIAALPVVLLLSAVWVVAEKANLFTIYAALWPVIALGIVWAAIGPQCATRLALPLSFLYFAIPVWDHLQAPLQEITSLMVGLLTKASGVSAVVDGHYITLPTGTIFIAQPCSGVEFLCISLAVAVLAGVVRRDSLATRVKILIVAGLISMLFNWLRILLIIFAHQRPDLQELERAHHIAFGWSVFAVGMIVFLVSLHFMPRSNVECIEPGTAVQFRTTKIRNSFGIGLAILAATALPLLTWGIPQFDSYPTKPAAADLGLSDLDTSIVAAELQWRPHYPGTAWEERLAILSQEGHVIEVYGNQYHEQSQGKELISGKSYLFDPAEFVTNASTIVELHTSVGEPVQANISSHTHISGVTWLTYHTYFVGSKSAAHGRHVQLLSAFRSLYSRDAVGVIAAAAPCNDPCAYLDATVKETFLRAVGNYHQTLAVLH